MLDISIGLLVVKSNMQSKVKNSRKHAYWEQPNKQKKDCGPSAFFWKGVFSPLYHFLGDQILSKNNTYMLEKEEKKHIPIYMFTYTKKHICMFIPAIVVHIGKIQA